VLLCAARPPQASATTLTRGPYLQLGTPTSVVVRWRSSDATDSRLVYGTAANDLSSTASGATDHEVKITGLTPGTRYWYGVGSSAGLLASGDSCTFVTPPAAGTRRPVRAWVLGDSGEPGAIQDSVRDAFLAWTGARGLDLMLMLGDNAYSSGTDTDYQAGLFVPYAQSLRQCVLWPTRGNHDQLHSGANNDYYEFFTLPAAGEAGGVASGTEAYYSYDWANVHFVCLDSEGSDNSPGGAMVTWLRADLAATDQDWIIVYWHHPPYSKGSHDSDREVALRNMRQNVVPVLDQLGADLVLCGHSHSYERSFLLRSHYGKSSTLVDTMKVDAGDGRRGGNGPYHKPAQQTPFAGAVYAVAGSSSHTGGGSLDHPVMVSSQNVPGSLVLDVSGEALDGRFLDAAGAVTDSFAIVKGSLVSVGGAPTPGSGFAILDAWPLPTRGAVELSYRLPCAGRARVAIYDEDGRRIATLGDGDEPAGERRARWNGRDTNGSRVAAGVYFAVVEFAGERRAARVVLTP
jgi:calcineurin-like phosphoesterase family protein/purple acid phosphatase-like protein/flagellar hook capping protein FlgD